MTRINEINSQIEIMKIRKIKNDYIFEKHDLYCKEMYEVHFKNKKIILLDAYNQYIIDLDIFLGEIRAILDA